VRQITSFYKVKSILDEYSKIFPGGDGKETFSS